MSAAHAFTARDYLVIAVIAGALGVAAYLKVGPDFSGTVVDGEVVGKREAIEMPLEDTWRHQFEIAYTYQSRDQRHPGMGRHPVDQALYDRLHVGSKVKVRYRRVALIGSDDSALADTSWWSRTPTQSESRRESTELAVFGIAAVIGFIAYRRESRWLGLAAATVAITVVSSIMLLGFFAFPVLFWVWRANPGKGFGWVLVVSSVCSTAALGYRVPKPDAVPPGPQGHATAIVRRLRTVDQIWASSSNSGESSGGEPIRRPFQMIDLEFTPAGASEPVHALDRVDAASVPGLKQGVMLPVTYSLANPRSARIVGGTREFGRHAFVYLLEVTYGIGGVVGLVIFPIVYLVQRLAGRSRFLKVAFDPAKRQRAIAQLPVDDPRRKQIERLLTPFQAPPHQD